MKIGREASRRAGSRRSLPQRAIQAGKLEADIQTIPNSRSAPHRRKVAPNPIYRMLRVTRMPAFPKRAKNVTQTKQVSSRACGTEFFCDLSITQLRVKNDSFRQLRSRHRENLGPSEVRTRKK